MNKLRYTLFCLFFIFSNQLARASHVIGGEIGYKHISGNTYEIYLSIYGDCAGASFVNLASAIPNIEIYNGTLAVGNINLNPYGNSGVNVTPVCPSQSLNTTCNNSTSGIPGIAEFKFKGQTTLNTNSANWQFVFNGSFGSGSAAGRSIAIDNLVSGSTTMKLVATLNNTTGPNTSANYTSIPTPFFCSNQPQQYNQGAIDPDGDVLSFSLVPGLNSSGGNVNYTGGFSSTNPLATTTGTFSFNSNNGQMAFQPNITQTSLVVNEVVEKRNGVIVGTSMREMNFIVLPNCTNLPASNIKIVNPSIGTIDALGQLHICAQASNLTFNVNATDPNGDTLNVTYDGLPTGASVNILNNNTSAPSLQFNWNIPVGIQLGNFTFFATFADNGCPLSSKQTIAYTIIVEDPIVATATLSSESCTPSGDASIVVNATSPNGFVSYSLAPNNYQASNTFSNLNTTTYTVYLKDAVGCFSQIICTIPPVVKSVIANLNTTNITCASGTNGKISTITNPSIGTFSFTLLPIGTTNNSGIFSNLLANTYTVILKDYKNCIDSAVTTITSPIAFDFTSVAATKLTCGSINGKILATTNNTNLVNFTINNGLQSNTTGLFENLNEGTYTVTATSITGCTTQVISYVGTNFNNFEIYAIGQNLPCIGRGDEGKAFVVIRGGTSPFNVLWNTTPAQATDTVRKLTAGKYQVVVTDFNNCVLKKEVYIESGSCCENVMIPSAFSPNLDGKNDKFGLTTTIGMKIKQYEIFNRWGQKVWEGNNQKDVWDGNIKSNPAKSDTYFFILKYTCESDGTDYLKKGELVLVR
jgi:gliding motility-associated-like protein